MTDVRAKIYDCAVVGAGCFGAWIALRLRELGRSVALIDAFESGNSRSSSGGTSRITRMGYGADETYTRWSMRSLPIWKDLFERVHQPELFQRTGVLWTSRAGYPHAQGTRAVFDRLGVTYQALSSDDLRKLYPQFRFGGELQGILEPESGALLAGRAVRAVAQEAARCGADPIMARVAPPVEASRLEWITTDDGRRIAARDYVFACGPWLPKVFPRLLGKRMHITRQEVLYFTAPDGDRRFDPPAMPIWIDFSDERCAYTIPGLAGKGFKLAFDRHGPEYDPDTGSRDVTEAQIAEARAFLKERFPDLAGAPFERAEVCQYENTCNGDFLIDRHPEVENIWLAGGGSGHGFKHGPAIGDYVASLLDGRIEPKSRFSLLTKTAARKRAVY